MKAPFVLFVLCALLCPISVAAASLSVVLSDQDGNPVEDAVMYVQTINGEAQATSPREVAVDQVDEMFVPHVRATTVGSLVNFPNSDHVHHHVYSFSEAKTFEVRLYIGEPEAPTLFDKAGLVTLGCNIHDHMLGYILILDTPWFVEVLAGTGTIENLPAGELAVEIWHPRLAEEDVVRRSIRVGATEQARFEVQVELRPERMVRRAPRRSGNRY